MITITQLISSVILMVATANSTDEILYGFDKPAESNAWHSVHDEMMGGVSDARFEITSAGMLRFYGKVSLQKNGAFPSIRSNHKERDLSKYDGILIRIKGDGKRYAFNIRTAFQVKAGSHSQGFDTANDTWQEVFLPFGSFQATAFGQVVRDAPSFNAAKTRSLGMTISDKQAGPFQIHLDWIKATRKPTAFRDRLVTAGCATCIFRMKDVTGCKLAVEIDGKHYLVHGTGIDDHGDAHAGDGLCNASRRTIVSGEFKEGVFVSTAFKVLPK